MKKILYTLALVSSLACVSCNDFLDRDMINKVDAGKYFSDEKSLLNYTNGFLVKYTSAATTLTYGDQNAEYVARTNLSNYYLDSWNSTNQTGWSISDWTMLYNINYFLTHMHEVSGVSQQTLDHYEGVGRFWRAWFYWAKVKTFGGVPWYDTPIDAEDMVALYKPRDSREYVMSKILEDLDYACEHCSDASAYVNCGVINRYIALAFKARVCLWEGTYRKYHAVNPETLAAWSTEYGTGDDYLRACVEAAGDLMASGQYQIVDNVAQRTTQYRALFNSEAIDYREVIWAREYSSASSILNDVTWRFSSSTNGNCWSMTKQFLNTYLKLDGTRYTDQAGYARNSFVDEMSDRDLRVQQTIITPAYRKTQNNVLDYYSPNFAITRTGYQVIKWNMDNDYYESSARSFNSLPIMRYAEVLLAYAEAKAELGSFTEEDWNNTIAVLRRRAGIEQVSYPTTADPYMKWYFDDTVSDAVLLEIRRERGCEMFMENTRYEDLMRWHLGHLIEREWQGIYAPLGVPQQLREGNYICIVQKVAGTERGTTYLVLRDNPSLMINKQDILVYNPYGASDGSTTGRVWTDKMYLHPIPYDARQVNKALTQNPGWE